MKAELSQLPTGDGRKAERRIVNLAAALREEGAKKTSITLLDISTGGFKADAPEPIEIGTEVWLKIEGLEARRSRVVWHRERDIGCEFEVPLHKAEIDLIVAPRPRRLPKAVFRRF
ncbi:MAG TPA: PilZ domain-containing protein [Allosphingosinicella sp.]|jgi:hypothetical protein